MQAAEAIRHLNGAVASGVKVTTILMGDGIYLGKEGQETETTGWTSLSAALKQTLKGGPQVYAHEPSLQERGLSLEHLVPGIQTTDDVAMATLLAGSRWLMIF
jgi:sulfur relay (sulfurtransferase) DsrF/TusC family protein